MQGTEKSLLALGQSEQGAGRVVQVESESLKDLSFYTKGNGEPFIGGFRSGFHLKVWLLNREQIIDDKCGSCETTREAIAVI